MPDSPQSCRVGERGAATAPPILPRRLEDQFLRSHSVVQRFHYRMVLAAYAASGAGEQSSGG